MKEKTELNKIWDNLGNLEGAIIGLDEIELLLQILEEDYFDKYKVELNNKEDMYILWRNWPYKQCLLNTIKRCLSQYNSDVKENVYQIYDHIRILKDNKKESSTISKFSKEQVA